MRECTRICLARAARRRGPVVLAMQHSILQTRRAQVEPRPSRSEHTAAAEVTSLQVFENNGRSLMPDSAIARVEKKRVRARAFLSHYTATAASPQQRTAAWQCLREPPAAVLSVLQAVKKAHYWSAVLLGLRSG